MTSHHYTVLAEIKQFDFPPLVTSSSQLHMIKSYSSRKPTIADNCINACIKMLRLHAACNNIQRNEHNE